ncbi:MAG: ATP-binding protein [Oligoflexia bacterium]|nr:ATP-binding protein [Oligoflexia bacterium]
MLMKILISFSFFFSFSIFLFLFTPPLSFFYLQASDQQNNNNKTESNSDNYTNLNQNDLECSKTKSKNNPLISFFNSSKKEEKEETTENFVFALEDLIAINLDKNPGDFATNGQDNLTDVISLYKKQNKIIDVDRKKRTSNIVDTITKYQFSPELFLRELVANAIDSYYPPEDNTNQLNKSNQLLKKTIPDPVKSRVVVTTTTKGSSNNINCDEISISDNGAGMSLDDILTRLLSPNSSNKKTSPTDTQKKTIGKFGQGFFSVLGMLDAGDDSKVTIETKKDGQKGYKLLFTKNKLGKIEIVISESKQTNSGTNINVKSKKLLPIIEQKKIVKDYFRHNRSATIELNSPNEKPAIINDPLKLKDATTIFPETVLSITKSPEEKFATKDKIIEGKTSIDVNGVVIEKIAFKNTNIYSDLSINFPPTIALTTDRLHIDYSDETNIQYIKDLLKNLIENGKWSELNSLAVLFKNSEYFGPEILEDNDFIGRWGVKFNKEFKCLPTFKEFINVKKINNQECVLIDPIYSDLAFCKYSSSYSGNSEKKIDGINSNRILDIKINEVDETTSNVNDFKPIFFAQKQNESILGNQLFIPKGFLASSLDQETLNYNISLLNEIIQHKIDPRGAKETYLKVVAINDKIENNIKSNKKNTEIKQSTTTKTLTKSLGEWDVRDNKEVQELSSKIFSEGTCDINLIEVSDINDPIINQYDLYNRHYPLLIKTANNKIYYKYSQAESLTSIEISHDILLKQIELELKRNYSDKYSADKIICDIIKSNNGLLQNQIGRDEQFTSYLNNELIKDDDLKLIKSDFIYYLRNFWIYKAESAGMIPHDEDYEKIKNEIYKSLMAKAIIDTKKCLKDVLGTGGSDLMNIKLLQTVMINGPDLNFCNPKEKIISKSNEIKKLIDEFKPPARVLEDILPLLIKNQKNLENITDFSKKLNSLQLKNLWKYFGEKVPFTDHTLFMKTLYYGEFLEGSDKQKHTIELLEVLGKLDMDEDNYNSDHMNYYFMEELVENWHNHHLYEKADIKKYMNQYFQLMKFSLKTKYKLSSADLNNIYNTFKNNLSITENFSFNIVNCDFQTISCTESDKKKLKSDCWDKLTACGAINETNFALFHELIFKKPAVQFYNFDLEKKEKKEKNKILDKLPLPLDLSKEWTDITSDKDVKRIMGKNTNKVNTQYEQAMSQNLNQMTWVGELIKNAKQAGSNKVNISIHKNDDGTISYEINDNGIGMNGDELKNIFIPGYSGKRITNSDKNFGQGFFSVFNPTDKIESVLIESCTKGGAKSKLGIRRPLKSTTSQIVLEKTEILTANDQKHCNENNKGTKIILKSSKQAETIDPAILLFRLMSTPSSGIKLEFNQTPIEEVTQEFNLSENKTMLSSHKIDAKIGETFHNKNNKDTIDLIEIYVQNGLEGQLLYNGDGVGSQLLGCYDLLPLEIVESFKNEKKSLIINIKGTLAQTSGRNGFINEKEIRPYVQLACLKAVLHKGINLSFNTESTDLKSSTIPSSYFKRFTKVGNMPYDFFYEFRFEDINNKFEGNEKDSLKLLELLNSDPSKRISHVLPTLHDLSSVVESAKNINANKDGLTWVKPLLHLQAYSINKKMLSLANIKTKIQNILLKHKILDKRTNDFFDNYNSRDLENALKKISDLKKKGYPELICEKFISTIKDHLKQKTITKKENGGQQIEISFTANNFDNQKSNFKGRLDLQDINTKNTIIKLDKIFSLFDKFMPLNANFNQKNITPTHSFIFTTDSINASANPVQGHIKFSINSDKFVELRDLLNTSIPTSLNYEKVYPVIISIIDTYTHEYTHILQGPGKNGHDKEFFEIQLKLKQSFDTFDHKQIEAILKL